MEDKTLKEIKESLENSGHSLHADVVSKLRGEKWRVLVGPHYSDNFTDKPREIDIIAEKDFYVHEYRGNTTLGTITVRLFIECKYISSTTVLWLDAKDKIKAGNLIESHGLNNPNRVSGRVNHHYFTDESVVKLTSSVGNTKNEEKEVINQAINQSLNALIYYKNKYEIVPRENTKIRTGDISKTVDYPIVVTKTYDKLFSTDLGNIDNIKIVNKPFQIEVNYAFLDEDRKRRNEYFLIDMVKSEELISFLKEKIESGDKDLLEQKVRELDSIDSNSYSDQ